MNKKKEMDKEAKPIGELVNQVLEKYRREADQDITKLWDLWEDTVGDPIADNTRPAAFKGKILIVYVSSSTWMQQLQFLKKDMIEKINNTLGEDLVEEIKFRIG
jgi:predicted nucleic acid-binding Zn ribbon protein